ncbi:MAG: sugar O-acetyltransferase [Muribaculaceae bacterium]|nr:sugar O-acetyltransferase [Muribaculaceae bacterium]
MQTSDLEAFEAEWQKMLDGEVYDAVHPEFLRRLAATREKLWEFNTIHPSEAGRQKEILRSLLGAVGEPFHVNPPFRCDYGCNISIGRNFFANFNLTILDEALVKIGDNVFIGPNVSIYTACHPLDATDRNTGAEWAEPVSIGDSVWIGGGATVLPGVSVGDRSVVGAGSVVTRDVPADVLVAGNPARIIKKLR